MDPLPGYLSPLGLALALAWNVAVVSSIQLTVRLIRAFSFRTTALAGLLLTGATVPITLGYHLLFKSRPEWLPAAMLLTGAVGFVIAERVLRFRRRRSTIVAAVGIGLLSAPWGAFLVRPAP
jgi:putative effector of murein hydrolase